MTEKLVCQNPACGTDQEVERRQLDIDLPVLTTCGVCWFALGDPDMRKLIWPGVDDADT